MCQCPRCIIAVYVSIHLWNLTPVVPAYTWHSPTVISAYIHPPPLPTLGRLQTSTLILLPNKSVISFFNLKEQHYVLPYIGWSVDHHHRMGMYSFMKMLKAWFIHVNVTVVIKIGPDRTGYWTLSFSAWHLKKIKYIENDSTARLGGHPEPLSRNRFHSPKSKPKGKLRFIEFCWCLPNNKVIRF